MTIAHHLTTLLLSTNLLVANSPADMLQYCQDNYSVPPSLPAQTNRTLQLDNLAIEVEIPENFRARLRGNLDKIVEVMPPEEFNYVQCLSENSVPTAPYLREV